jgi:hypothetical protein
MEHWYEMAKIAGCTKILSDTMVATNQWITHYYRLGETRRNSQTLSQLFCQDRSLSKFTWHPLEVYWWGLLPWEWRDSDRINMEDQYEMAKIAGIELISEWHNNICLWNQTNGSINSNTFTIYYIRFFVSIHYTKNEANYSPLSMIFFGYIILFFHTLHEKCSELQCTLHDLLWFLILNHPLLS